jgi:betaine reductase
VKALAERFGTEELVLVFGLNQPFSLRIMATTFKEGDPSFTGALGGIALGLRSYHIFELKSDVPPEVWEREMAFKELEMEADAVETICALMREIRGE